MDIELPGNLNGYETSAEILKMDDRTKIIFISGGSGVYRKDFLHNERTRFIKMPFSGDDIMQLLQINEK